MCFFIYTAFLTACTKQNPVINSELTSNSNNESSQEVQEEPTKTEKNSSSLNIIQTDDEEAYSEPEPSNETITYEDADYQDLGDFQEENDGRYVRISGQVSKMDDHRIFFEDKIYESSVEIVLNLDQFDKDVSDLLKDGDYIVVTGKFNKSTYGDLGNPFLEECHLELIGDKAKAVFESDKTDWKKIGEERLQEYIKNAQIYPYDEVARYPEKHQGEVVAFSGTVLQGDEYTLLLKMDDSADKIIYVHRFYEKDGERLLKNDYITVYGTLEGLKEYTTVIGTLKEVPYLAAKYIIR